jgi:hypothetical protein
MKVLYCVNLEDIDGEFQVLSNFETSEIEIFNRLKNCFSSIVCRPKMIDPSTITLWEGVPTIDKTKLLPKLKQKKHTESKAFTS